MLEATRAEAAEAKAALETQLSNEATKARKSKGVTSLIGDAFELKYNVNHISLTHIPFLLYCPRRQLGDGHAHAVQRNEEQGRPCLPVPSNCGLDGYVCVCVCSIIYSCHE